MPITKSTPQENSSRVTGILSSHREELLESWLNRQIASQKLKSDSQETSELRRNSHDVLNCVADAAQASGIDNTRSDAWGTARETLTEISRNRAKEGFTPTQTATFVFSLKQPVFDLLAREYGAADDLAKDIQRVSALIDELGLFTTEVHQKSREEIIYRQQREMMELSTPVVKLWEGVLALPLIGTLDSERTQVVMENLLEEIVRNSASIAIIDITGVPTVDTLVAQHLMKTVAAARLMGADCIISGIRPQIASTIVHLGVELGNVTTKATLADALTIALRRMGVSIVKSASGRVHTEGL